MDVDRMSAGERFEASSENKMPACTDVQLKTDTSELDLCMGMGIMGMGIPIPMGFLWEWE